LWEREVVEVSGAVNYEEIGRAYTAINDLEAGRFRLTVLSDLPNCLNDNPARRYMKTFTLGGVESLGLVEGPSLSADLCDGGPGIVTLKLFDNTGSTEGDLTFYYNGNLVVSSYKGNGDYEVYIDHPVDNASLYMVNTLGCDLIEELTLGAPVAAFAYSSPNFDSSGTLFEQEEITFTNQAIGDFALAVWNFGDGTEVRVDPATDPAEIIHTYEFSGTYQVSLEIFNVSGCSRSYSESLSVGLGYQILFPNVFTPNGDGINEYFEGEFIGITSFELSIYNTWGGLVTTMTYAYEDKPLHWGWNGNYLDGSPYTQKYFRYVFTALTIKGVQVTRAGEAVILR
jgi:gliding motility-associated-like protein